MAQLSNTSKLAEKQIISILTGLLGTLINTYDEKEVFNAFDWIIANQHDVKKVLSVAKAHVDQSNLLNDMKLEFQQR